MGQTCTQPLIIHTRLQAVYIIFPVPLGISGLGIKRVLFPNRPVGVIMSEGKPGEPLDWRATCEYKLYFI